MHVPDGFFDAATSVGAAAVSAGTIAVGVRKAADDLTDRLAPLAGLVAAFVFALQMLNFPVASGTSGHLLGGALAAVLVGPWVGMLCIAVVLAVQGLLFADGGLSAYGINVLLMAIVPSFVGIWVFRVVRRFLPATKGAVAAAAGVAGFVSVPVAAAVFAVLFAVGGTVDLSFGSVLAAMVGTHVIVGIGEGLITFAVVAAVVGTRPDLVYGASDLVPDLVLTRAGGSTMSEQVTERTRRMSTNVKLFIAAGLLVGLALAIFVSPFASSSPDGLEKVSVEEGFDGAADEHDLADGPLADYAVDGVDDQKLSTGLSGLIGVLITFGVGLGLFALIRTLPERDGDSGGAGSATTPA